MHPLSSSALSLGIPSTLVADGPPLSLTLMMGLTCGAVGLVVGVLVIGAFVSMVQKKGDEEKKEPPDPKT